ncbi:DUF6452 family protein [Winogradskyella sp. A3E31]|uniref:DUF6452 family protein n=1 Tax=Winogradskyella sp. A3E31 TaxID=3349637 RepID=UPI00398B63EE
MKIFKSILLLCTLVLLSCERDDICAEGTPTTPRLFIEFYDDADPETLKSVTRLTIYGEGLYDPEDSETEVDPNVFIVNNSNVNAASLPLNIGTEGQPITTRFIIERDTNLRLDENPETDSNIDILEISYVPQFEYVSRACGFKSIFTELSVQIIQDEDNWTSSVNLSPAIIETQTVENENEVHVFIFH